MAGRPGRVLWWAGIVPLAALLGLGLATMAEYVFFRGRLASLNLVVWALLAIALGGLARTWPRALASTAVIGGTIVFAYSVLGYAGSAPLVHALPAFAALSITGAVAMSAAAAAGQGVRRMHGRLRRRAQRAPSWPLRTSGPGPQPAAQITPASP